MDNIHQEITSGTRFKFGENWSHFLTLITDERIHTAEASLQSMLGIERLDGKTFLDVGSGSGLFSLAARRLGARVVSFDFDPQSVACTSELKYRYFNDDEEWTIFEGSALDTTFLQKLEQFDIVYSWGVLHHTGNMWKALENIVPLVAPQGHLFISIYNDQGYISKLWLQIKKLYCSGRIGQVTVKMNWIPYFALRSFMKDLLTLRNPFKRYRHYKQERGMSKVHDWYDWLGGLPFEVARPEEIFAFYSDHDFQMVHMITCGGGLGCNQFVFNNRSSKV